MKGTKVLVKQIAHLKVAQLKPGAFRPQACLYCTMHTRVKANTKLILIYASLQHVYPATETVHTVEGTYISL